MNHITISNINPGEFSPEHYDFSLPTTYHQIHGIVMLQGDIRPYPAKEIIEVPGSKTIRETFEEGYPRVKGGTPVTVKISPTADCPNPMEFMHGGHYGRSSIIVPDNWKWGELFQKCMNLEDVCRTEFLPIGAAPENEISEFVKRMLVSKRRI